MSSSSNNQEANKTARVVEHGFDEKNRVSIAAAINTTNHAPVLRVVQPREEGRRRLQLAAVPEEEEEEVVDNDENHHPPRPSFTSVPVVQPPREGRLLQRLQEETKSNVLVDITRRESSSTNASNVHSPPPPPPPLRQDAAEASANNNVHNAIATTEDEKVVVVINHVDDDDGNHDPPSVASAAPVVQPREGPRLPRLQQDETASNVLVDMTRRESSSTNTILASPPPPPPPQWVAAAASANNNAHNTNAIAPATATTRTTSNAEHKIDVALKILRVGDASQAAKAIRDSLFPLLIDENNALIARRLDAPCVIVSALQQHTSSFGVQYFGLSCIFRILDYADLPLRAATGREIINTGGLGCCIRAMEQRFSGYDYSAHSCQQVIGLALIHSLWSEPELREAVVDAGGLASLLKAYDNYKQDEDVVYVVLVALYFLLIPEMTYAETLVNYGCTEIATAAMQTHGSHTAIQRNGCQFLAALAQSDEHYRQRIMGANGLHLVVQARINHHDNEDVVRAAQTFFSAFVVVPPSHPSNVDNQSIMSSNSNGETTASSYEQEITTLIECLSSPTLELDVAEKTIKKLFAQVRYSDAGRKTAFRRGVSAVVANVMNQFLECSRIQKHSCNIFAAMSLCGLDAARDEIIEVGLKSCLSAMDRHGDDPDVQGAGCRTIGTLWFKGPTKHIRRFVWEAGGREAVLDAFMMHKQHARVQCYACYAFAKFLKYKPSRAKAAFGYGCLPLILDAMTIHPDHAGIQVFGCEFLHGLGSQCRDQIAQTDGFTLAAQAWKNHSQNADVVKQAQNALSRLIME